MNAINIRQVDVKEIYELRQKMLRPNQPIESVHFDGDDAPTTKHAAVFFGGAIVGCVSLMLCAKSDFDEKIQYQMRGMAVDKPYQKQGFGKALIKYAEFLALNRNVDFIWLNARCDVRKFYEKQGYTAFGEEFMIPTVCKHIVMYKKIVEGECESCKNAKNKTV